MSLLLCTSLVPAPALARVPEGEEEVATVSQPADNAATAESTQDATATAEAKSKDSAADQNEAPSDKQSADPTVAEPAKPADKAGAHAPARVPASLSETYANGDSGNDDTGDGTSDHPFKTIEKAQAALTSGKGVVHIAGSFTLTKTIKVADGVTIDVMADTTMNASSGITGLHLNGGSKLRTSHGATLTMKEFGIAIKIDKNAVITDGSYVFSSTNDTCAVEFRGNIQGSSQGSVKMSLSNCCFRSSSSKSIIENTTIDQRYEGNHWELYEWSGFKAKNSVIKTYRMPFYFKGPVELDNSTLSTDGTGVNYQTGIYMANAWERGDYHITNGSVLEVKNYSTHWRSKGLTLGYGAKIIFDNGAKFVASNNVNGGLNINDGTAIFDNATLESSLHSGSQFGVQKGQFIFKGNSVVNTPAQEDADNGLNSAGADGYVVLGGSHLVKYAPNYYAGKTIPTNGAENGNERLTLFTLSDSSVSSLNPLNINGAPYTYPVATASRDGQKHVWVPAAKVTFKLNNTDATFADSTAADKQISTIRGYEPDAVVGNTHPGTPSDKNGVKFLGWFYKDSAGTEHAFNYSDKVSTDLEVYAKWDAKAVIYHNGDGESYIQTLDNSATSAQALSYDEVVKANNKFARDGKDFISWSTAENGGKDVAEGSELSFTEGMTQIDLYAKWNAQKYTVSFSANGGTFSDDSVFKKNPDVFEIKQDAKGGDVAVVKQGAEYGQTLHDILGSFDYNQLKPDTKATKAHEVLDDSNNWNESASGKGTNYRFDDFTFFGFVVSGHNPTLTKDVTYYLKWKTDPEIKEIKQDLTLNGDLWSISEKTSSKLQYIRPDKETFSITGQIDAQPIQEQMKNTEALFADAANEPDKILLDQLKSSFTATFTVPDGVKVTDNPKVVATGLGDCFTLGDVTQTGNTITAKFNLKSGIRTYKELQDAVASVGKNDTQTGTLKQMRRAGDPQVTPAKIQIMIDGFTLDGTKVTQDGALFHMNGKLTGNFSSYATHNNSTKKFVFSWKAKQDAKGNDEAGQGKTVNDAKPATNDTISYTVAATLPAKSTLPGDIRINNNTTHNSTYGTLPGKKVDVTGALNVQTIKNQMAGIEQLYPNVAHNKIDVDIHKFGFVAKFTVPHEMKLPELTKDDVKLENFGGFKIVDVKVEGNTVVVKMDLADDIATYDQLEHAVDSAGVVDGWMKISIPRVEVKSNTGEGKQLTVTGTVEGSFDALATSQNSGKNRRFLFTWKAEQWPDGKDSIATDDKTIQATLETPTTITQDLSGDIRIGEETEHEAVYPTKPNATLDYAGWLNKQSIQEQMSSIEQLYPKVTDYTKLTVDVPNCTFTATFTMPDGLTLPSVVKATAKDFGPYFSITQTKVSPDGKTVTVTMKLDTTNIKTYADLQKAVQQAGDADGWMKAIIPGVKVNGDVKSGTRLTVVGTVAGDMQATVTSESGTTKAFKFHWDGKQWADGKDATAPANDTSIRFTVEVKADPTQPGKPHTPNTPGKSNTGKKVTKKVTKKVIRKLSPQTGDLLLPVGGIAVAGIVVVGAALILRKRNGNKD